MRAVITILAFVMLAAACTQSVDDHVSEAIPYRFRAVLENPDKFELITVAMDGEEIPEGGDGSRLWGDFFLVDTRTIEEVETQEALVKGLYDAIALQEDKAAACFEPHHGIRVSSGGTEVIILVCFICHNFRVHPSGGNRGKYIEVGKMKKWRDEVKRLGMLEVAKTRMTGEPP